MDITKELVDDLNAVVKISLTATDYQERVNAQLLTHQKKATMKGFRAGKVPFSVVKKLYGTSVKADEINKVLQDSINKYIQEEKLEILGNPLPQENDSINFETQDEFVFAYDLGLAPVVDLKLNKKVKFTQFNIVPGEEMIDNYVKDISSKYGSMSAPDTIEGEDMVQVNVSGVFAEEEVANDSTLAMQKLLDAGKKKFSGKKVGDVVKAKIEQLYEGKNELATLIGKQPEDAENFEGEFSFEITSISRLVPSELNQELFDKVYGEGTVKTEEEFRNKIKEESGSFLSTEGNRKLKNDIIEALVEKTEFSLPDEFLKRWLQRVSEKPVTAEQVEADYSNYQKSLKWQLIENRIIRDNDVKVEADEIHAKALELINANMAQYGQPPVPAEESAEIVGRVLSNQDEARKLNEMLYEDKVINIVKDSCKLEEKEISYDDFIKLVTEKK
jgi:trigger factor